MPNAMLWNWRETWPKQCQLLSWLLEMTTSKRRPGALRIRVIGRPLYVRGQKDNPISGRMLSEILEADVVHCHQQHIVASSVAATMCRLTGRKVFVSDLGGGGWDISSYIKTDKWYHSHLHISQYSREVSGHGDQPWAHVILRRC